MTVQEVGGGLAKVRGKGARERLLPLTPKTLTSVEDYLEGREGHRSATAGSLWLGLKGRLTESGIARMLRRRCAQAGTEDINPHQLRHTFAHNWLLNGGSEGDLMKLAGGVARRCSVGMGPRRLLSAPSQRMPG